MMSFSSSNYIPLLSLKPAEMAALEELPEKDKGNLLPLISLKKWGNSRKLENSLIRVNKAFSDRVRIFDIDKSYLKQCQGKHELSSCDQDLLNLADSNNGYRNWVSFFSDNNNYIPVIQLDDLDELSYELDQFLKLDRPFVIRFEMQGENRIKNKDFNFVIKTLIQKRRLISEMLIMFDYGDFSRADLLNYSEYASLINKLHEFFPKAYFSISGTSFPYSFLGAYRGEIPIYERQIFNKVQNESEGVLLIYSDRASTRAENMNGGGGIPPPRIDYPLKNDWRFIRKELVDGDEHEKERLYRQAAIEVMNSEYWISDLHLWGTQMIEKTSLGDPFGITSANRATAVRINLHLYQQLHYHVDLNTLDTDEDWED